MSLFCSDGRTAPPASKILGIPLISVLKCLKLKQHPDVAQDLPCSEIKCSSEAEKEGMAQKGRRC